MLPCKHGKIDEVLLVKCMGGEYHVRIVATEDIQPGHLLVPSTICSPRILLQFDGSAHRRAQVGLNPQDPPSLSGEPVQFRHAKTTLLQKREVLILQCPSMKNTFSYSLSKVVLPSHLTGYEEISNP